MILTSENYFCAEAGKEYMSTSQYKSFAECELKALAEMNGLYQRDSSVALMVGSYVDAHFDKTLDIFKAQHPEIFKRDGSLKSEYVQAESIINRVERDPVFMEYMSGAKQVIKTGEIDGVPFKIKMDSYHEGKMIVDLKVIRDFAPIYKDGEGRMNFIEAWGYDIQGAIYQAIEGNKLPFYIAAVTKEKEPDLAVIQIPQYKLDVALDIVRHNIQHYKNLKDGVYEPVGCGVCDYCKSIKKLKGPVDMDQFFEVE